MKYKFTPGPWSISRVDTLQSTIIRHGIAPLTTRDDDRVITLTLDRHNGVANARLIAAAPEAVKFVEFVAKVSNGAASSQEIQDMGLEAYTWLAKVTGVDE